MRNLLAKAKPLMKCVVIIAVVLGVFGCVPLLSKAHAPSTNITIVNNSSKEIRHVYLSPSNSDNWGPDQLEPSTIGSNGSFTMSDVSCPTADVKVIAEDQDGCFYYKVVTCDESTTWTITSQSTRDCGN